MEQTDQLYLQYVIATPDTDTRDWLIALLGEMGVEGFEEQDTTLFASGEEKNMQESDIDELLRENSIDFEKRRQKPENYNAIWESSFHPVQVGTFAGIRASFHAEMPVVKHEIIITPKMSFGTGHHATTWMMIKAMEDIDFSGKKVIDFGTGTGVLAILAEKCGASAVMAIDNDDWSIENAVENISANRCTHIVLENADHLPTELKVDILMANINLNVLLDHTNAIRDVLLPGGYAIISGLLNTDRELFNTHMQSVELVLEKSYEKGDWTCLVYKKLSD